MLLLIDHIPSTSLLRHPNKSVILLSSLHVSNSQVIVLLKGSFVYSHFNLGVRLRCKGVEDETVWERVVQYQSKSLLVSTKIFIFTHFLDELFILAISSRVSHSKRVVFLQVPNSLVKQSLHSCVYSSLCSCSHFEIQLWNLQVTWVTLVDFSVHVLERLHVEHNFCCFFRNASSLLYLSVTISTVVTYKCHDNDFFEKGDGSDAHVRHARQATGVALSWESEHFFVWVFLSIFQVTAFYLLVKVLREVNGWCSNFWTPHSIRLQFVQQFFLLFLRLSLLCLLLLVWVPYLGVSVLWCSWWVRVCSILLFFLRVRVIRVILSTFSFIVCLWVFTFLLFLAFLINFLLQ